MKVQEIQETNSAIIGFYASVKFSHFRSVMVVYYACKSYRSKDDQEKNRFANRWVDSDVDKQTLLVWLGFLEDGCQLLLQLYFFETAGWSDDKWELGEYLCFELSMCVWMCGLV